MNAVAMLKEDHRIVDGLFKEVESTPPSSHPAIFKRIKGELDAHAHVEEAILYPALKRKGEKELKDSVLEGFEEHHHMHISLSEITKLTPRQESYEAKLKVMIEMVRHHVKEEENEMFKLAEDQLGDDALEKLGKKMELKKAEFMKAEGTKPEPRPVPTTLGGLVDSAKKAISSAIGNGDGARSQRKTKANTKGKSAPAAAKARSANASKKKAAGQRKTAAATAR